MSTDPDQNQATGRGAIPVDSFANRLMLARAHAGHISIREAADLCDLGRGAWTNWEKGARPVDVIEVAAVVAEKLGVDQEWLLFGGALGEAERRSLRRRGRETDEVMRRYRSIAEQLPTVPARPRDTRPPGHPVGAGIRRSSLLPRPHRRPGT